MVNKRVIATNDTLSLILDDGENAQGHVEDGKGFVGPTHSIYSIMARPGWKLVSNKVVIPIAIKGGPGSGNYGHAGRPGLVGGSSTAGGTAFAGAGFKPGGLTIDSMKADISNDYASAFLSTGLPGADESGMFVDVPGSMVSAWSAASAGTRSAIKAGICVDLAGRTGLYQAEVNDLIEQWSKTSNDNDMRAFALQMAAAEELGLELSEWQQESVDGMAEKYEETSSNVRIWPTGEQLIQDYMRNNYPGLAPPSPQTMDNNKAIIRAMYDNTQQALQQTGFQPDDTIRLYRGFHRSEESVGDWKPGDLVDYQGNAIESWSVSRDEAARFGKDAGLLRGIVVAMDVPVRNVVGTARTGFGCLTEGEFVIAGNIPGSQARVEGVAQFGEGGPEGIGHYHQWYQEGS